MHSSRSLEIRSLNFDFIPSRIESPKSLWVELKFFPPSDLKLDTVVRLHLTNTQELCSMDKQKLSAIQELLDSSKLLASTFYVNDIVGKRIVLNPMQGSPWKPNKMKGCRTFGSGFNTTTKSPGYKWTSYGSGESFLFMSYKAGCLKSSPIMIPYPYYH